MEAFQRDFIRFMLDCGALRFGRFTTKSGRSTPYFIDTGLYVSGPQMRRLGWFYAEAIERAFGRDFDNLFGPAYKGIPLAVAAAMALGDRGHEVTYTFNRKEIKDHGEGGIFVGFQYGKAGSGMPAREQRVLIIEDVTTAGTSVRESLPLIQACPGARVMGLVVSVDRMERGRGEESALKELQEELGVRAAAIVDFLDLVEYLESGKADAVLRAAGVAREELVRAMLAYRKEYGAP